LDTSSLTNDHAIFNSYSMSEWPQFRRGTTDAAGSTIIEYEFGTSASHEHPSPRAHLMNYSVQVEADGFGGVVVPVGNDERQTSEMRKDGEVVVSIGLLPIKQIRVVEMPAPHKTRSAGRNTE
jgi:hypothetical protein